MINHTYLRIWSHAGKMLMELEQLDQLGRFLGYFCDQLGVLVCIGGKSIRCLLGAEAVVFLSVLQDADVRVSLGKQAWTEHQKY